MEKFSSLGLNELSVGFKVFKIAYTEFEHDFRHWATYGLFVFRLENSPSFLKSLKNVIKLGFLTHMIH